MVFPESILVYQPTRAKALNPTYTRLKIASSVSCPYLWRREREACTPAPARGARLGSARTDELRSLCARAACVSGLWVGAAAELRRVLRFVRPDCT